MSHFPIRSCGKANRYESFFAIREKMRKCFGRYTPLSVLNMLPSDPELFSRHRKLNAAEQDLLKLKISTHRNLRRINSEYLTKYKQISTLAFDFITAEINAHGVFDLQDLDTLFDFMHAQAPNVFSGTALDIGANIGNHALYFSDHFRDVIAFEPNPRVLPLLHINAQLASNISCRDYGVSSKETVASFSINHGNIGASRIPSEQMPPDHTIPLRPLDAEFGDRRDITFMKVDVEGHELDVFLGARKLIENNKPIIFFEQFETEIENGTSPAIDLLRAMGYAKFATIVRSTNDTISSSRPGRLINKINSSRLGGLINHIYFLISQKGILTITDKVVCVDRFEKQFYNAIIALPELQEVAPRSST